MSHNPTAPQVAIELDKPRHLRFDFNAAAKFESVTGKNLFVGDVLSNLSATDLRALLWACLVHEDAELTLEHVGELVHFGNVRDVSNALTQVYRLNIPDSDGGGGRPTQAP